MISGSGCEDTVVPMDHFRKNAVYAAAHIYKWYITKLG